MGKVLIVGASGYIGLGLFECLNKKFITLGTSTQGSGKFIRLNLEFPENFQYDLFIASGDIVVIAAAISAPDICTNEYERARSVNVLGTIFFIRNVISRGARVIFFSSDAVYGENEQIFDESCSPKPVGEYAEMKYQVEQLFGSDPSFKSIRLSYVFSSEDKFTKYLIRCVMRDEEAEIFHPFSRSVIHRIDVIDGVIGLIEKWNEVAQSCINFGGPELLSRVEFKDVFKKNFSHKLKSKVVEPPPTFFLNRPRIIAMQSPILKALLGRPSRNLAAAMKIELSKRQIKF